MTNAIEQYNAAIEQVSRTWRETMDALDRQYPNRGNGGMIRATGSAEARTAWAEGHQAAVRADREARRVAMETLKESNKFIAWAMDRGTWGDYEEACKAFLARTPATKSSLFAWAKNTRGWCDDFDNLYEEAEQAGALEGLILPEPESTTSPALTPVPDPDDLVTGEPEQGTPMPSTPGAVAAAREALLNLGETHGGGAGRRRVGELMGNIVAGRGRGELLGLAREYGGDEGRDRVAGLLNTIYGPNQGTESHATGVVLPDHLAAREELLRLAGRQAGEEGRRTVADLLDRIDRGRTAVVADDEVEGDEV